MFLSSTVGWPLKFLVWREITQIFRKSAKKSKKKYFCLVSSQAESQKVILKNPFFQTFLSLERDIFHLGLNSIILSHIPPTLILSFLEIIFQVSASSCLFFQVMEAIFKPIDL